MSAYEAWDEVHHDVQNHAVDYDDIARAAYLGVMEDLASTAPPLRAAFDAVKAAGGTDEFAEICSEEAAVFYHEQHLSAFGEWVLREGLDPAAVEREVDGCMPEALAATSTLLQRYPCGCDMRRKLRGALRELCARVAPLPDDVVTALSRGLRLAMRGVLPYVTVRIGKVDDAGEHTAVFLDVHPVAPHDAEPIERFKIAEDALHLAAAAWCLRPRTVTSLVVRQFGPSDRAPFRLLARAQVHWLDGIGGHEMAWDAEHYHDGELLPMTWPELAETL